MLNEKMEFDAYVSDPKSEKPRLQPKLLTDSYKQEKNNGYKLRGIDQIMVIILRDFLFSDHENGFFEDGLITDKGIMSSKEVLNKWTGFYEFTEEGQKKQVSSAVLNWLNKHQKADGWLREFWIFHYGRIKSTGKSKAKDRKKENARQEWNQCAKMWFEKYNSKDSYSAESVTYDNIIAGAIERGPLHEKYFVIKKENDGQRIKNLKEFHKYLFTVEGNIVEYTCQKMLRNIIAFLIGQNEHPGKQKEVLLQRLRLFGWYGKDDGDGKTNEWCFEQYKWNNKSVMYNIDGKGNDFAKYGIDEEYIKKYDMKLIDYDKAKDYRNSHWILKDDGYGKEQPLKIINNIL